MDGNGFHGRHAPVGDVAWTQFAVPSVAAGLGIAWLPDCITHEYVASGTLVPIMRRYPTFGRRVCRPTAGSAPRSQSPGPRRTADRVLRTKPGRLGSRPLEHEQGEALSTNCVRRLLHCEPNRNSAIGRLIPALGCRQGQPEVVPRTGNLSDRIACYYSNIILVS